MKITSEAADKLIASDKNLSALFIGPILGVIGLGIAAAGVSSHSVAPILFGLVFVVIGVVVVVTRKSRLLTIDKGAGTLTLATKGITGAKTLPYNLADVVKLQLVSQYSTQYNRGTAGSNQGPGLSFGTGGIGIGGNTSTQQTTHLIVVMRDGTNLDVADGARSMGAMAIVSHVPNQEVGERIATFIGVPLETVGASMPSLADVAKTAENLLHHNDPAPSVTPSPLQSPVAAPPAPPVASPTPDGAGFAMPRTPPPAAPTPPPTATPPAPIDDTTPPS
jgi:hypothetical protein